MHLTIEPSTLTPKLLLKRKENRCPHQDLCVNNYNSFIDNHWNLKQPKCSQQINCGASIQWSPTQPKKDWTSDTWAMWMTLKSIMQSERSQSRNTVCCMIPFIWHPGKGQTTGMEIPYISPKFIGINILQDHFLHANQLMRKKAYVGKTQTQVCTLFEWKKMFIIVLFLTLFKGKGWMNDL